MPVEMICGSWLLRNSSRVTRLRVPPIYVMDRGLPGYLVVLGGADLSNVLGPGTRYSCERDPLRCSLLACWLSAELLASRGRLGAQFRQNSGSLGGGSYRSLLR